LPYENYIKPIPIKKSDDIFNLIQGKCDECCPDIRENYIFRGLENVEYDLVPSSLRQEEKNGKIIKKIDKFYNHSQLYDNSIYQTLKEIVVLKKFLNLADKSGLKVPYNHKLRLIMDNVVDNDLINSLLNNNTWPDDEYFEIISLAQHYGLPTIALDWSYNYKTALYFATVGCLWKKNKDNDCVLWALNYQIFEKYFSKEEGTQRLNNCPLYIYRPQYHLNPFMAAQKGLFTFWREKVGSAEINRTPLDEKIEKLMDGQLRDMCGIESLEKMKKEIMKNDIKLLYKFIIPSKFKEKILKELNIEGCSEEYIYPGYSGVVSSIKNSTRLNKKYKNDVSSINSNKETIIEMIENNMI
jgi:hypothetical protein